MHMNKKGANKIIKMLNDKFHLLKNSFILFMNINFKIFSNNNLFIFNNFIFYNL